MTKKSKTILFFGNERLATGVSSNIAIFKSLIDAGYNIPAVIVSQKNINGDKKDESTEVVEEAKKDGITVLNPNKLQEIKDQLIAYNAVAAVLVAYGKIIPQSIIDIFPAGIINIHPSLLPKHRGPTPLESVILAGETETAVSIMQLTAEMDAGPIYKQQAVRLSGTETKQELADKLDAVGKELLESYLEQILDGRLKPIKQPNEGATYDKLITKKEGEINWSRSADYITRQIRAYAGWPRSKTSLNGIDVIITKAHCEELHGSVGQVFIKDDQIGVYAASGALIIDSLVPSGKKEMDSNSFLLGYRSRFN